MVHDIEPKAPIIGMKTVEHQLEESLATERMIALLSVGFSLLATALSILGLYGVIAFMATQRSREIGIRMALGALSGRVVWLVMSEAVLIVAIGITIAIPLAIALGGLVRSELFGIEPANPAAIILPVLLLTGIALLARFIPAQRAASSDPLRVLRYE